MMTELRRMVITFSEEEIQISSTYAHFGELRNLTRMDWPSERAINVPAISLLTKTYSRMHQVRRRWLLRW